MRKWIALLESNAFIDAVKNMTPHDTVGVEAGYGYTLDGDTFEITDDHVIEMKRRIEQRLTSNPTVYRYILLRPAELPKYLSGPLGTYWCHDWDINLFTLTGWDSAPAEAELYRLTARVEITKVDMVRSVLQNLAVPWENEIKIIAGSPLILQAVDLLPDADVNDRPVKQSVSAGSHSA